MNGADRARAALEHMAPVTGASSWQRPELRPVPPPPHERITLDEVRIGDRLLAGQLTVRIDRIEHDWQTEGVSVSGPHPTAWQFEDQVRIGWAGLGSSTVRRRTDHAETD